MDKTSTLILLAAAAAFCVFAGWRGAQPSDPVRGVRMVPWRLLMVLGGAVVFVLGIHLATLYGAPQRQM